MVAGMLRRNRKITSTTRPIDSVSSNSTSLTEARIVMVRSVSGVIAIACGSDRGQRRQQLLDAVDDLDDVRAGLALDVDDAAPASRSSTPTAACSRRRSRRVATSVSSTGAPLR